MSIDKPIFIVGTGRCGSTIFHDIMAKHRALAWLTQYTNRFPRKPSKNKALMVMRSNPLTRPLFNYLVDKRARIYPVEAYTFWDTYCHGFSTPYRDLFASDVFPHVVGNVRSALERSIPGNNRLLVKITGWPRIGYLQKIFPDAKFIHIKRDGRPVVSSVLKAPYFDGWSGPNSWNRGVLSQEQERKWKESGESFEVLAAIGWENRMRAFEVAKQNLSNDHFLEIKYEDLCANQNNIFPQVLDFLELNSEYNQQFLEDVSLVQLSTSNEKWRRDLTLEQQIHLDDYLSPLLSEFGY